MKKTVSVLSAAITALSLSAFTAQASDFELGLGLPYYGFDNEIDLKDKHGYNLNFGYRFDAPFGVELSYSEVKTRLESDSDADVKFKDLHLDGLWYLHNEGNVLPYAALGVGQQDISIPDGYELGDGEDKPMAVNAGLGVKFHLHPRLRARIDGRWIHDLDNYFNHSAVTFGLGYVFGATETAAAPAPVVAAPAPKVDGDADNDGVKDSLDKCPETAAKLKVDTDGCPVALTEEVSIDLKVQFATGSSVVEDQYLSEIKAVATFMEQYANSVVVVEGHTDSVGAAAANKTLSQSRADSVAKVLVDQFGVDSSRVKAMGYGEEKLLVAEKTKADQAANRRVVAKVSAKKESFETK
jgi:OmpA-OmpF porin, OOP family